MSLWRGRRFGSFVIEGGRNRRRRDGGGVYYIYIFFLLIVPFFDARARLFIYLFLFIDKTA
jgi:hypothetical protein